MPLNKIILCPNPARDAGLESTKQTMEILAEMNVPFVVCPLLERGSEIILPREITYGNLRDELPNADMVICFGGDGTIMRVARAASGFDIPVLSINKGHLGFIAELESVDADMIRRAVNGDFRRDRRIMLDISLVRDDETVYNAFAFNDAVVSKGGVAKMIDVSVYSDESRMTHFLGDGLIIATPSGSTGYSMSAGGPLVEPEGDSIIVTPICAHSMTAKSFVLSRNRTVSVIVGALADRTAYLSVDGSSSIELASGDVIRAARSERVATLVRLRDADFYKTINSKLKSDIKE